ncbi:DUF3592 domain-containing protein [Taibaiella koreensis]|uniref:hypothetical protein n=1 Tax=Taibaiella koreensis TaxID=1268548 RepID=UPI000E59D79F|nr:hypothetical protein [Taibaiella koreensis]
MHLLILQITSYGWTALGLLLLSIVMAAGILRRGGRNRRPGCVSMGYVTLVVFIIFGFTASLGGMLGGFVYNVFTLPRYQARVVDHETYISESRDNGSTRRTTMYRPIVVFTDQNGQERQLKSDVSSSGPQAIGALLTVGYRPGMDNAEEFSTSKYLLVGGGTLMLLILAYFSIAAIAYASGAGMEKLTRTGVKLLLFLVVPLVMLAFMAGLGYAVIAYFRGDKPDMPVWALAICIFFILVLLPSFYAYIRLLAGKTW